MISNRIMEGSIMQEKIITGRKYGMAVLLGYLALLAAAVPRHHLRRGARPCFLRCSRRSVRFFRLDRALRPAYPQAAGSARAHALRQVYRHAQGAMGFYYVNPFCVGGQPRGEHEAQPKRRCGRRQERAIVIAAGQTSGSIEVAGNKKISLKIMTLNNSRQKINDCLRQPRGDRHRGHVARGGHGEGRL